MNGEAIKMKKLLEETEFQQQQTTTNNINYYNKLQETNRNENKIA